ncbi:MAG: PorP/SprF family type IX secretion system membrane protein [Marinifilaceae bacterium]|jgi:type IX secretion system PorP/SprF family membrane protein|nr:PorP/SprF family type IX secretion system membrane protein [Marinifilaceae bacterium]
MRLFFNKILISCILLLLCCCLATYNNTVSAQQTDISQIKSIPILLNPAQTGGSMNLIRAAALYKNQWNTVSTPFSTQIAYADMKRGLKNRQSSNLGIGALLMSEKEGVLNTTCFGLASSLYTSLGNRNHTFVHIGARLDLYNKAVKKNDLIFGDQWDGAIFNKDKQSHEDLSTESIFYMDVSLGGLFSFHYNQTTYEIGISASKLNSPNVSFFDADNKMKPEFLIHANAKINKGLRQIIPSVIIFNDSGSNLIAAGVDVFKSIKAYGLMYGLWYKSNKSLVPMIGFSYNSRYSFKLSYDYSLESNPELVKRNSLEVSISYEFRPRTGNIISTRKKKRKSNKDKALDCPKSNY